MEYKKIISVISYIGSIIFANFLVKWFGIIDVFGLIFPAGAIMIGLCFSLRDIVQKQYGKYWCWIWMIIATLTTLFFSKEVAIASGIAFFVTETLDWFVFTYSKLSFKNRIILSNFISLPIDSLIFVPLVFGWIWPAIIGQGVIKILSSFIVIPFIHKTQYK